MLTESRRRQLRLLLSIVLDGSMVAMAFFLAYLLRFRWEVVPAADSPPPGPYFAPLALVVPAWIALFAAYGLYRDRPGGFADEALRVASAVSVGMMGVLAGTFFYRQFSYSRLWVLFAWALSLVLVVAVRGVRRVAHRALRARGVDVRHVLIVGTGPEARAVAAILRARPEYGQRPVGFVDGGAGEIDGLPVVGTPELVLAAVRRAGAHRVIIALPGDARQTILHVAAACREAGVPFAIVPDLYTLAATGAEVELVDRLPLLTLRDNPLAGWGQRVKDVLDVVGAVAGLLCALPLFAAIALLIKLDSPGPVFYRHRRVGKGGVPFFAWKFRTMVVDAEEHLARDPSLRERFRRAFKLPDDPRVTRVGRWLRRTSLDELPQLLNVLRGEMSLVGPRPVVEEELAKYGPWERRLLCVKPGLTGLWQVLRHHELDYDRRVSLDLYYIDHWSVGLDLKILLRTLPSVIAGRGAY
ncbi:MAG: sugar transferase [Armatimonadota bacterium]|nr:sugar transferase [Armatimonadota bacterium]